VAFHIFSMIGRAKYVRPTVHARKIPHWRPAGSLAVHAYTVNQSAELERLARLCVDGMFTNFPDRYRAIIATGGLNCPPAIR
jgi:glycerophosphoryl diester phosphodiesterase